MLFLQLNQGSVGAIWRCFSLHLDRISLRLRRPPRLRQLRSSEQVPGVDPELVPYKMGFWPQSHLFVLRVMSHILYLKVGPRLWQFLHIIPSSCLPRLLPRGFELVRKNPHFVCKLLHGKHGTRDSRWFPCSCVRRGLWTDEDTCKRSEDQVRRLQTFAACNAEPRTDVHKIPFLIGSSFGCGSWHQDTFWLTYPIG